MGLSVLTIGMAEQTEVWPIRISEIGVVCDFSVLVVHTGERVFAPVVTANAVRVFSRHAAAEIRIVALGTGVALVGAVGDGECGLRMRTANGRPPCHGAMAVVAGGGVETGMGWIGRPIVVCLVAQDALSVCDVGVLEDRRLPRNIGVAQSALGWKDVDMGRRGGGLVLGRMADAAIAGRNRHDSWIVLARAATEG